MPDYVAIALAQIERAKAAGKPAPKIIVRRIELTSADQKKRKREENKGERPRREYEFVDCLKLYESIVRHLRSTYGVKDACKGAEGYLWNMVISLCGCDFTTGIPRVGPTTLWKHMRVIWGPLQDAYDPSTKQFNVRKVADNVVAPLLAIVHKKHAGNASSKNITKLLETIKASPNMSENARNAIPSVADIACLVRGSNWTIQYWYIPHPCKPT